MSPASGEFRYSFLKTFILLVENSTQPALFTKICLESIAITQLISFKKMIIK